MSANFYELLKYAATGIASPDMTYYDRMRASTLMGGVVQTLTGQPPLSFKSDGKPLISWSMKGNGQQTGTPTPDAPIMPTFCGVRTANLFDKDSISYPTGTTIKYFPIEVPDGTYTLSTNFPDFDTKDIFFLAGNASSGASSSGNGVSLSTTRTRTAENGYVTVAMRYNEARANPADYDIMLNLGSTALPYEPYGWKIPLTCAGQTTPVYLGQVSTVRRIKCVDLGTLTYTKTGSGNFSATLGDGKVVGNSEIAPAICSHFKVVSANNYSSMSYSLCTAINNQSVVSVNKTGFEEMTAEEFKSAMSGVLLWYALKTEQTGIVNEPLAKIGDYADELSSEDAAATIPTAKGQNTLTVETELQPSEMAITFKG